MTKRGWCSSIGVLAIALGSCGRNDACPPLTVTVDGREMPMVATFGRRLPERGGGGLEAAAFNHGDMDCPRFLEAGWPMKQDQLFLAAVIGKDRTNVAVNASNEPGRPLVLVAEPKAEGDTLSICIPEPLTFTGDLAYKGHTVVVRGLVTGKFCGQGR